MMILKWSSLFVFLIVTNSFALTAKDIVLFKADQKGVLHQIETEKLGKVQVILDGKAICGKTETHTPLKVKPSKLNSEPVCKPDYTSKVKFSQSHKMSENSIPLAIGISGCDLEVFKETKSDSNKKLVSQFKKANNLPPYLYEQAKIFVGSGGEKYLSFTGVIGKKVKSSELSAFKYMIEGVVKRDFFFYDLKDKKFLLIRNAQTCCDPNSDTYHLCSVPGHSQLPCFDPSRGLEKMNSLAKHKGNLYSYTVGPGLEGVHAYVWQIKDGKRTRVFHKSFYAIDGCE